MSRDRVRRFTLAACGAMVAVGVPVCSPTAAAFAGEKASEPAQPEAGGASAMTTITLRGGDRTVSGKLLEIGPEGVRVQVEADGAEFWFSWDRVRSVSGAGESSAEAFAGVADRLWRARTRLDRGDAPGAEPLFEALFERYAGGSGATSRVVAEGLLRCRLRRNAYASAVEPWLSAMSAGATGFDASSASLEGEGTPRLLVPALPPIWTDTPSAHALARSGWAEPAPGDVASALAVLYRASAAFETGRPIDPDALRAARGVRDPEAEFVRAIVDSRIGTAPERAGGRAYLAVRVEAGLPPWAEAWARAALGRSLLRESDEEQRLLGIVELMHLPARLRGAQPYLAGLAMHEAAGALAELGLGEEASRVRDEFRRSFPGHPLLSAGLGETFKTAMSRAPGSDPGAVERARGR